MKTSDDRRRETYAELRRQVGMNEEEETNDTSRSIRLRIGDVLNFRLRMKHAITLASIGTLLTAAGGVSGAVPMPAFVTRAWVDGVNKQMEKNATISARLDAQDATLKALNEEVWALRCDMTDEWRWQAIDDGKAARARYLAQRLHELGLRAGRQCP